MRILLNPGRTVQSINAPYRIGSVCCFLLVLLFVTTPVWAQISEQSALFINVHGGSYDADALSMYNTLVDAGALADWVDLSFNGEAATMIQAGDYDQIWIFDLSAGVDNYAPDWQAVVDWFNADPDQPIICDGRVISSYWNGRWNTEGRNLTANYYYNMKLRGGGLFLGTDHNSYNPGINTVNAGIGIEPFFGNFSLTYIPVDVLNPLMTEPNDLGVQLFDDSSPGQTPYGLQPNGRILYTVAWHSGNPDTPGISSTIEGAVGFHASITAPSNGSSFYNESITFTALGTGGDLPYTFNWTSDVDGPLGPGENLMIDSNTLSIGPHIITLVGTDAMSRIDDDQIGITILAPTPTPTPTMTPTATPTSTPEPTATPTPDSTATQTPDPNCLHHGDTDFSGRITAADSQFAFGVSLEIFTPTYYEWCAADCNDSGNVTAEDAQTIFGMVLGIPGCVDPIE